MDCPASSDLRAQVASGDRRLLARVISEVEDGGSEATRLLAAFHDAAPGAWIIGITGAPGAGKSTLTSQLITAIRARSLTVAVVAVDPSSPFTGGAILGDRIRMQEHVGDDGVYIRSMSSRGRLGGLAASVPEVVSILSGAGFDVVLIETVGVGQAEVDIVRQADTTAVVVTPGWGDGVQANKAGLLEIGDVFIVNKADRDGAGATAQDLEVMLDLGEQYAGEPDWRPPVVATVATEGEGIADLLAALDRHRAHLSEGEGMRRIEQRRTATFREVLSRGIVAHASAHADVDGLAADVAAGTLDPWTAADRVLDDLGLG